MRNSAIIVVMTLSIGLMIGITAELKVVSAQIPVDYDKDDDGLIEIEYLEQINAISWCYASIIFAGCVNEFCRFHSLSDC